MMKFALACFLLPVVLFANSISLFNNSPYKLRAVVYDANGKVLTDVVLDVRDATEWSDDYMNFGAETSDYYVMPYTIEWTCMNGDPFATCNNVAAGSVVMAQNCQGPQECGGDQGEF